MTYDKNKYKMFRNFMVNELGISREDLELWTKEAVSKEVVKVLRSTYTEKLIKGEILALMYGSRYSRTITKDFEDIIRREISKQIHNKIKLTLEE